MFNIPTTGKKRARWTYGYQSGTEKKKLIFKSVDRYELNSMAIGKNIPDTIPRKEILIKIPMTFQTVVVVGWIRLHGCLDLLPFP